MKKYLALPMCLLLFGCSGLLASLFPPPKTPLEIQAIQTREFEAPKGLVFRAVITALQNASYTIENSDMDTGYVLAKGLATRGTREKPIMGMIEGELGVIGSDTLAYSSRRVITATISERNTNRTAVRLNIVLTYEGEGGRDDKRLLGEALYQKLFEAIANSVFVAQGQN